MRPSRATGGRNVTMLHQTVGPRTLKVPARHPGPAPPSRSTDSLTATAESGRLEHTPNERAADDDGVGVLGDLGRLRARSTRRARRRPAARSPRAPGRPGQAPRITRLLAGTGDAHDRGRVDEAATRCGGRSPAAPRSSSARRGRPCPDACRRLPRSTRPPSSGIRSGVISPAPPAAASSAAKRSDAVPLDRVPVGHHEGRRDCSDLARPREDVARACPPARACSAARWMVGPSMTGSL